jgi:hypothetical protein
MKQTKECIRCHALKPLDEFSSNGLTTSGRQKYKGPCKVCEAKRIKKYRRGDPFLYLVLKCGRCSNRSNVRIYTSTEDGTHAYLCETCTKILMEKNNANH